jgi:hypothetical protein
MDSFLIGESLCSVQTVLTGGFESLAAVGIDPSIAAAGFRVG